MSCYNFLKLWRDKVVFETSNKPTNQSKMAVDVLLGLQWGDEGKGKIVDHLAENYKIVARFQGGPNAGHTLKFDGKKFVLHTVPSGIFRAHLINFIGNGVVIDPITLKKELDNVGSAGIDYQKQLLVAKKAHLILPSHRYLDAASENSKGKSKIGSTLKGIGPTYMDKTGRNGLRVGDLLSPSFYHKYKSIRQKHLELLHIYPPVAFDLKADEEKFFDNLDSLKSLQIIDGEYFINDAISKGERILAEGAQGSMLDIDFGTYPYVTSSNTITAGVCSGLGIAPRHVGEVIGVTKAYCTRVGSGPFPTELDDATGDFLRKEGAEFGSTTGRPRRCGWIDLPQLKYTIMLNGVTQLVITKIDVLNNLSTIEAATDYDIDGEITTQCPFDMDDANIKPIYKSFKGWEKTLVGIHKYENLPLAARNYVTALETYLGVPATMISTGADRKDLIVR
jgi:adenylosuccinate synthase